MKPQIAIPEPCSYDREYSNRALPYYLQAVEKSGGEAVVIPLGLSPEEIARRITRCSAILLPGSKADVDPQKYGAAPHPRSAAPDPLRDAADELLLQDAYNMRKPVFGICYGLQSLNVWRTGTLVQHIESKVNHSVGSKAGMCHGVTVAEDSLLRKDVVDSQAVKAVPVNSSHHQSAEVIGDGLRAVAYCADDNIVEAIEGTSPEHYVMAVQWHPERTYEQDEFSNNLFKTFVEAAQRWNDQHS